MQMVDFILETVPISKELLQELQDRYLNNLTVNYE